ncbi:MAG: amidohydrolase [candidate division KSB1 bacterium]|jgi:predicted amidohydrolase YtcJ|nr:amidohydrolase [candidate division KSB1 bacterium]
MENHIDLILLNGRIYTVNDKTPWIEALACHRGRIVAMGCTSEIKNLASDHTQIIDLQGAFACPGFNDAHVDFYRGGLSLESVDLRECNSKDAFIEKLALYVQDIKPGRWILEGNWNHENWPEAVLPDKSLIDAFTKDIPVCICRSDEHVSLANTCALRLAGITSDSPNPAGGEIVKDSATGEPTGILIDTAQNLVYNVIPEPLPEELMTTIRGALRHAASWGITSIQDNTSRAVLKIYQQLLREGELTVRVNAWRPISTTDAFDKIGIEQAFGNDMLRIGVGKIFADGSMGAGSALFFDPYTDNPATTGIAIYPEEELTDLIVRADAAGLQCAVHAIGDRANHLVLKGFERAYQRNSERDRRHRIEHLQVIQPDDLDLVSKMGIIASVQPSHFLDDIPWAEQRIGSKRVRQLYLWQTLIHRGIRMAFGTDWPVTSISPLRTIYSAVTRSMPGSGAVNSEHSGEKISLKDAIACQTLGSAFAEYTERDKGTLEVGKLADIAVLSKNLFEISPEEILDTSVEYTIMGGRITYQSQDNGH